jgi:hypothetical protein
MPRGAVFRLRSERIELVESDVVKTCLDICRLRGYWPTRQHIGKFQTLDGRWITAGEKGLPDYAMTHGVYRGFLLEFKRPGGELSEVQVQKKFELELGYSLAIAVIDSPEALVAWLANHERSP